MFKGKYIYIIVLLMVMVAIGCDKLVEDNVDAITTDDENCNCFLEEEPESYDVTLKLTINAENPSVPVTIFYGNIERKRVAAELTSENNYATVNLKLNHNYTYMAKYLRGSDTIYVPVNAQLSTSSYVCHEDTCWTINNNVINLKLK